MGQSVNPHVWDNHVKLDDRAPLKELKRQQAGPDGRRKITREDYAERARMIEHLNANPAYKHNYQRDTHLPTESKKQASKKPAAKKAATRSRSMRGKR